MSNWISVERLQDWPGLGELYNVQFEGMTGATTVVRQPGELIEHLIERTRRRFSAREKERDNGNTEMSGAKEALRDDAK